jgi:hypothetical protein
MSLQSKSDVVCCPKFDPSHWDDRMIEWKNKTFIKDKVFTLFNIPLNFGQVMKRLDDKVKKAGAEMPDFLCLSEHSSKWNMNVYLAVNKQIPGAENTTLSGKFYSKVYEGPFQETGKWCKDFEAIIKSKELSIIKLFMWYTTCPKCAKKYGKNYVAILGQME